MVTTMVVAMTLVGVGGSLGYRAYMRANASVSEIRAFAGDLSNLRRLAGFADNVFLGRVVSGGVFQARHDTVHRTVFQVEVLTSLKGELSGTIAVSQVGGTDGYGNRYVLRDVDPLELGSDYIFSTRTHADPSLGESAAPAWGHQLVDDSTRDDWIERYEAAIARQIPASVPNPVTQARS